MLNHFATQDGPSRTLDLTSTLEGSSNARAAGEGDANGYNLRSVLTIAFQFTFENHLRDNVAAMARQYVRSVVGSVQRVAMAIAPSRPGTQLGPKSHPGSPEAHALARWICRSYRFDYKHLISYSTNLPFSIISPYFISCLCQGTYQCRSFSR
jgi:homeobox-leucine zipper protein